MPKSIDMIGKRFGKLLVLERAANSKNHNERRFKCRCDCGRMHVVRGTSLRKGLCVGCSKCKRPQGWSGEPRKKTPPIYRAAREDALLKGGEQADIALTMAGGYWLQNPKIHGKPPTIPRVYRARMNQLIADHQAAQEAASSRHGGRTL